MAGILLRFAQLRVSGEKQLTASGNIAYVVSGFLSNGRKARVVSGIEYDQHCPVAQLLLQYGHGTNVSLVAEKRQAAQND